MPNEVITTLIGVLGTIAIALIGLYGARKLKIGTAQEKLVDTLQALIEAQDRKIKELTDSLNDAHTKIITLEQEVEALKSLTIEQALEIKGLENAVSDRSLYRRKRMASQNKGGDLV